MADEKDAKNQEEAKPEKGGEEKPRGGYLQWIVLAVVVVLCAVAGLGVGRLFGRSRAADAPGASGQAGPSEQPLLGADTAAGESEKTWYYDFEPVVANLNEPGVTRYVRAVLTLEIGTEVDEKTGAGLFEAKKPQLKNWLTLYLANLALEDIRGGRNLKRIQAQILEAFNERLFPNAKPQIKHVLFKEFAVQ